MKATKPVTKKTAVKKATSSVTTSAFVKTSADKSAVKAKKPTVKAVEKSVKPVKELKSKAKKVVAVDLSDEAKEKQKVIEKYAQKSGDTGSPEVQVALLSYKIGRLSEHLNLNKKDNHSRRGLLKVVAKRRRILNYLQKLNEDRYKVLIGSLSLKK